MSADLPDEFTASDVCDQAVGLSIASTAINLVSTYLMAEDGSEEESASDAVDDYLRQVVNLPDSAVISTLLTFAGVLIATGDRDAVQEWFTARSKAVGDLLWGSDG